MSGFLGQKSILRFLDQLITHVSKKNNNNILPSILVPISHFCSKINRHQTLGFSSENTVCGSSSSHIRKADFAAEVHFSEDTLTSQQNTPV